MTPRYFICVGRLMEEHLTLYQLNRLEGMGYHALKSTHTPEDIRCDEHGKSRYLMVWNAFRPYEDSMRYHGHQTSALADQYRQAVREAMEETGLELLLVGDTCPDAMLQQMKEDGIRYLSMNAAGAVTQRSYEDET